MSDLWKFLADYQGQFKDFLVGSKIMEFETFFNVWQLKHQQNQYLNLETKSPTSVCKKFSSISPSWPYKFKRKSVKNCCSFGNFGAKTTTESIDNATSDKHKQVAVSKTINWRLKNQQSAMFQFFITKY